MKINKTHIEGVQVIELFTHKDERGQFVKTFHKQDFQDSGIDFQIRESFYSISALNVIRGMHFHHPPRQHAKIIFCPYGRILDVALDLRKESPTYGQSVSLELSAENNRALYIPEGLAHGFKSLEEGACTYYLVSGEYSPAQDDGILYSSFDFNWGLGTPVLSERDLHFAAFKDFKSPF